MRRDVYRFRRTANSTGGSALVAEDIPFAAGRIDLERYRWRPELDDAPEMYFDG